MDEKSIYEQSRKRADELGEFYQHLMIYVIINLILFTINMLTSPVYLWFIWPLAGWGLGIAIHKEHMGGLLFCLQPGKFAG